MKSQDENIINERKPPTIAAIATAALTLDSDAQEVVPTEHENRRKPSVPRIVAHVRQNKNVQRMSRALTLPASFRQKYAVMGALAAPQTNAKPSEDKITRLNSSDWPFRRADAVPPTNIVANALAIHTGSARKLLEHTTGSTLAVLDSSRDFRPSVPGRTRKYGNVCFYPNAQHGPSRSGD
jgi:hypothetical protein